MTPGLAFFYAGFAREKSALNMLVMNLTALGLLLLLPLLQISRPEISSLPCSSSGGQSALDVLGLFSELRRKQSNHRQSHQNAVH